MTIERWAQSSTTVAFGLRYSQGILLAADQAAASRVVQDVAYVKLHLASILELWEGGCAKRRGKEESGLHAGRWFCGLK